MKVRTHIRLVTFDILHTLVTPRQAIPLQYAEVFKPFLGALDTDAIQKSFKNALKDLKREHPTYSNTGGHAEWWSEVVKRTACGAGADSRVVDASLSQIVPVLLQRFSSKEGYKLFDDVPPVLREIKQSNTKMALISNTDSRMLNVLDDLDLSHYFSSILVSEKEGVEKPTRDIYLRAIAKSGTNTKPEECLHIGDDLECDYLGAKNAGMHALLLDRTGSYRTKPPSIITREEVLNGLEGVLDWLKAS